MSVFKKMFGTAKGDDSKIDSKAKSESKSDKSFSNSNEGKVAEGEGDNLGSNFQGRKMCLDDFELLKTVGKGSFGAVYQVKLKANGKIYAMKVLNKENVIARKQYDHTLTERKVLQDVKHPFLVSLRFAFQSTTKLYMVFDFFNGGELYFYLSKGKFTEDRARFYCAEIALGIGHLHERGIIYRDLKPENLLLDADGHIRITDFGLSKEGVDGENVKSICGTPEYLAPEVLQKKPYGFGVDWWSLGTLLYEMIGGLPPFYDKNRQRMYKKILEAELERKEGMSNEAFSIISKFLDRNTETRLGKNGLSEIKRDPFFKTIDWDKLYRKEVEPPFRPMVENNADTSKIDECFTSEAPIVTPTPAGTVLSDPDAFTGFSYVPGIDTKNRK